MSLPGEPGREVIIEPLEPLRVVPLPVPEDPYPIEEPAPEPAPVEPEKVPA